MITSFEIIKYRRFRNIKFNNLGRLNIFLGNNNSGKTSILEALFTFACGPNVSGALTGAMLRDNKLSSAYDLMERILAIFYDQNEKPFTFAFKATIDQHNVQEFTHIIEPYALFSELKPILMGSFGASSYAPVAKQPKLTLGQNGELTSAIQPINLGKWVVKDGRKRAYKLNLDFPPNIQPENPFMLGRLVDILSHRKQQENVRIYSFLKREEVLEEFTREMSKSLLDIESIDVIPYPDGSLAPVSIKTTSRGTLPLYAYGDGIQRWFNILGGLLLYQNAVHCIEEVDATFHPVAQQHLAKNLYKYAKNYGNQLFMTSHSLEFIDNFFEGLKQADFPLDEVRIITLKADPETGDVRVRVLDGIEALESREKYQMDLR